jgi:hypothetical protein
MNLLAQLATQIAGGASAAALDRAKPEWTRHVGASATSAGVAITPGAMAAVGLALVLALLPGSAGSATAPMWKKIAANLAGGGLVYEGVKIAELEVLPRIQTAPAPPQIAPTPLPAATHGVGNLPYYGHTITDYELAQALGSYRRAA